MAAIIIYRRYWDKLWSNECHVYKKNRSISCSYTDYTFTNVKCHQTLNRQSDSALPCSGSEHVNMKPGAASILIWLPALTLRAKVNLSGNRMQTTTRCPMLPASIWHSSHFKAVWQPKGSLWAAEILSFPAASTTWRRRCVAVHRYSARPVAIAITKRRLQSDEF